MAQTDFWLWDPSGTYRGKPQHLSVPTCAAGRGVQRSSSALLCALLSSEQPLCLVVKSSASPCGGKYTSQHPPPLTQGKPCWGLRSTFPAEITAIFSGHLGPGGCQLPRARLLPLPSASVSVGTPIPLGQMGVSPCSYTAPACTQVHSGCSAILVGLDGKALTPQIARSQACMSLGVGGWAPVCALECRYGCKGTRLQG